MLGATFGGGWLLFALLVVVVTFGAFLVGCVRGCFSPLVVVVVASFVVGGGAFVSLCVGGGCPCLLSCSERQPKEEVDPVTQSRWENGGSMGQSFGDDWATDALHANYDARCLHDGVSRAAPLVHAPLTILTETIADLSK